MQPVGVLVRQRDGLARAGAALGTLPQGWGVESGTKWGRFLHQGDKIGIISPSCRAAMQLGCTSGQNRDELDHHMAQGGESAQRDKMGTLVPRAW